MNKGQPLKENHEDVIAFLAQGKTQQQIADKFGVSQVAVCKYKQSYYQEVCDKALEYIQDAAGTSAFHLAYASRLLAKKLEQGETLETDELIKIIREFRATAEAIIKKGGDINLTNIENLTIEQMAGRLAHTKTREELEAVIDRYRPRQLPSPGDNGGNGGGARESD